MASITSGFEKIIIWTLMVWTLPAIIAILSRNRPTVFSRYLGPIISLCLIVAIMALGAASGPIS